MKTWRPLLCFLALLAWAPTPKDTSATVARPSCKRHTAVRFELAEFATHLSPCAHVKDVLVEAAHRMLNSKGIRVGNTDEWTLPTLQLRVAGFIRDDGFGAYSVTLTLHEDLEHLVDGQKCLADVVSWSTHPDVNLIDSKSCDDITRIVSAAVGSFVGGQHHGAW